MSFYADLTLDELLNDPLVRAVMAADRIDASALEAELRGVARERAQLSSPVDTGKPDKRAARGLENWERAAVCRPIAIDCRQILASPPATYRTFAARGRDNACGTFQPW